VDESFSRYPVYKKSLDNIVGFIHTKDIYKRLALGMKENIKLSKMLVVRKALNVPETKKIDDVLLDMRKKHVHMAAVYDEFGMMVGIVTLEDIIESLVGDIQDEFDTPIKGIQRNADGSYVIDGNMSADVIQKRFHLPIKGHRYRTIGGMIFGLLGREPHVGDELEIGHLFFDVMEISGKRIKLLRLKRQAKN
jgi:CBS domain containing-hemolysin-like protein